jgi:hypothetical protein
LISQAKKSVSSADFLDECRELSNSFFSKVVDLVKVALVKPDQSDIQTVPILAKRNAQLEFSLREAWSFVKQMNHRLSRLENGLKKD